MSQYSPLHAYHLASGAKLADFGGWEMPIEYPAANGGGVLNEHLAVRQRVGLFDVSHLGKASVTGSGALDFLNSVLTNDLNRISDGQAQYTLICDPVSGGVIDDLIVYRHSADNLFLVPNAANTEEVVKRLIAAAPAGVLIENAHTKFAVFALQGPNSIDVLNKLAISANLEYMSFASAQIENCEITLCRTGYTGELGFEIICKWDEAAQLWETILNSVKEFDGKVAGLGARDTLRTEMGYPLHGHELSLDITPVEASAGWAVSWEKEFWGKEVMLKQRESKQHRTLQALLVKDRGIPRAEMKVLDVDGNQIGVVTSGTFSPTLRCGIALALMDSKMSLDADVKIDIRGKVSTATVRRAPFVASHVR